MSQWPIVERELRLAARRAGTYWGRAAAGAGALALVAWVVLVGGLAPGGGQPAGRATFLTLSAVALFSSVLTALRLTSPSIAMEKREGTLGLLFLTDLRSWDIVLGKLAVTCLSTFFQFLAVLPVLAIPFLLGGVTAGDFTRLVLVLINLMLLAAAVGMFASAVARDERSASGLALILLIGLLAGGPVLAWVGLWWGLAPGLATLGFMASPGYACMPFLSLASAGFWASLLMGHALAWAFLGFTCWLLPRVWREKSRTPQSAARRDWWRNWTFGAGLERRARRQALLEVNPILWLCMRDRWLRWQPWIFLAIVGALLVWAGLKFPVRWFDPGLGIGMFWILHAGLKIWVASHSAHALSVDRDRGALELVLSTPFPVGEVLRGHWLGLWRMFAAPWMCVLAGQFILLGLSLLLGRKDAELTRGMQLWAHLALVGMLALDIWAAGWVGLWSGVAARNGNEAAGRAQLRVLWLPWIGVMLIQSLAGTVFHQPLSFPMLVALWVVLGVGADVGFALRARRKLATELRTAAMLRAAGQVVEPYGWLGRLGRWLGLTWVRR